MTVPYPVAEIDPSDQLVEEPQSIVFCEASLLVLGLMPVNVVS